ncbi:MAG: CHAD domain-containing protein [Actinomycetota bacterium]|nr:CHAD domain-containing protein [Actinomycetota bacterium]
MAGAIALVRHRQARRARSERARSYRLYADEPVADGIRRIARGQIDLAAQGLERDGDVDGAVHEARKALKRLRALLRLVRDEIGDEVYRRENTTFRDAGRALSGVRDARVMADTLGALTERHEEELPPDAFTGLRDALEAEAKAASERLLEDAGAVRSVLVTLGKARTRVVTWPLPEQASIAVLASGAQRIYRRGRRAARRAREDPGTAALHDLRKRAKDMWHTAQVLHAADPEGMRDLAREAHGLSDLIGEEHDLAVLLEGAEERAGRLRPGELDLLEALVSRRRSVLGDEALAKAGRLYRRKPRKLAATVARATPG